MKKIIIALALALTPLSFVPAVSAAPVGNVQGLQYDAATRKLFGENQNFASEMEITSNSSDGNVTITSRMTASDSRCRFEFSVADIKGAQMPPDAAAQMKAMGMDRTVVISTDGGRNVMLVYPGLQSYVTMPVTQAMGAEGTVDDLKIEMTEIGSETVDGHKCAKNKVTVTDKQGTKHESTVWNAKDLRNFPVMIQTNEGGAATTMRFRNVSFDKPADTLFAPPAGYTQYPNMQTMMQQEMMKRMAQMQSGESTDE